MTTGTENRVKATFKKRVCEHELVYCLRLMHVANFEYKESYYIYVFIVEYFSQTRKINYKLHLNKLHLLKYTHFEHGILVNLTNVTTGSMKME